MSIRQRGDTWWIDIRTPGGERIRRSAETTDRRAAQEYHDRLKAELWRQNKLGTQPQRTFDEAAVRFLRECTQQSDFESKVRHIGYWRGIFGGKPLGEITTESVADNAPVERVYPNGRVLVLKPASTNRYVATLRTMMGYAADWKWITAAPKLKELTEPKVRIRWITQGQARTLIHSVTQPWLQDVVSFALATGARASEILGLTWEQVDLSNRTAWLEADETKSARARSVPLNDDAVVILARRVGTHKTHVFSRAKKPINKVDQRMFQVACATAGIANFRFHDLRHTWASWHVQAGTPLLVLKELGGWETIEMVQKYAHLGRSHLASHADAVTFWAQQQKLSGPDAQTPLARAA